MTKVVHLTSAHPSRDIRIFEKECRSLARAGYEVVLIAQAEREETIEGVRIVPLPKPSGRLQRVFGLLGQLHALALRENADLYHFHDPEVMFVGFRLKRAGFKVVYDVHENMPQDILHSKPYIPRALRRILSAGAMRMENRAGQCFDGIVTVTEHFRQRFPAEKTAVVQNYPILDEFMGLGEQPYADRSNVIVFTGGLTRSRCAVAMVDAMAGLDARLEVVGAAPSPDLKLELENSTGWSKTNFRGRVPLSEAQGLLANARIGLVLNMPREDYVEISTNKLFEYMAAELPVVVSDIASWRRIVEEAGCGIVANTTSGEGIARACSELLQDPALATEMGRRGGIAAREKYSWATEERNLLDLYQMLGVTP